MLLKIPLSDVKEDIVRYTVSEMEIQDLYENINTDIKDLFHFTVADILESYSMLGTHLIGEWESLEQVSSVMRRLVKKNVVNVYPYIAVLSREFSKVTGIETERIEYIDNGNKVNSSSKNSEETEENDEYNTHDRNNYKSLQKTDDTSENSERNDYKTVDKNEAEDFSESASKIDSSTKDKNNNITKTSNKEIDGSENSGKSNSKNSNEITEGNNTVRSAHEESPISQGTISSAPGASSSWNLSPSSKDGAQNDSSSSTTLSENDGEYAQKSNVAHEDSSEAENGIENAVDSNSESSAKSSNKANTATESTNDNGSVSSQIGAVEGISESEGETGNTRKQNYKDNFSENAESSYENSENAGNKQRETVNPEMMLKILKFNVNELNIVGISKKYAMNFIDEFNVLY